MSDSSPDWKRVLDEARRAALKERDMAIQLLQQTQRTHRQWVPPGHFYSPLPDVNAFAGRTEAPHDGADWWEHVGLDPEAQRNVYAKLLEDHPLPDFPVQAAPGFRYHLDNNFFRACDAFTLSALLRREKPKRIVEVGSGFSSAVMLDTLDLFGLQAELTFIEPYPDRLQALLRPQDAERVRLRQQSVQEVPLNLFTGLAAGDILFIDSSHVAKVGSDVTFLLLRVLPALAQGVLVHIHDIFYPESYPIQWLQEGRAWNESIVLRAFLVGNRSFEIEAFNAYALAVGRDLFEKKMPAFAAEGGGGSLWLRKTG